MDGVSPICNARRRLLWGDSLTGKCVYLFDSRNMLSFLSRKRWLVSAALGVAIAVILVTPAAPFVPFGLAFHRACTLSNPLVTTQLWTPVSLLNSPYGGNATAEAVINRALSGATTNESITIGNGQAAGLFSLDNWTLRQQQNSIQLGPGPSQSCSPKYVAVDLSRDRWNYSSKNQASDYLSPPNSTTNAFEPTRVSLSIGQSQVSYGSVIFNNSYWASNAVSISLCGTAVNGWRQISKSTENIVTVPFSVGTQTIDVNVTLSGSIAYSYSIPPGVSGNYSVENLASHSGGGLAFQWVHC
jgi:hypothetical protein